MSKVIVFLFLSLSFSLVADVQKEKNVSVSQSQKMEGYASLDDAFLFFERYASVPQSERAVSTRKLLHGLMFCADEYICPFQKMPVAVKIPAIIYVVKKMFKNKQETALLENLRKTQSLWKGGFSFEMKESSASVLSDLYSLIALLHEMYVNNLEWLNESEVVQDTNLFLVPATQAGLLMPKIRLGVCSKEDVQHFLKTLDPLLKKQEKRGLYRIVMLKILDLRNKLKALHN